jgi:heterodisulfide reductase subunit B2
MTAYSYFPGCSLSATGVPYDQSLKTVSKVLNVELEELDDWNCCGATAYFSVSETLSHAISARNLAIAEKTRKDLVAPCSACYLGLRKTNDYLKEFADLRQRVDGALAAAGLNYQGTVHVRHLLDVYMNDVGLPAIKAKVGRPLVGLKVASYSGCQMVRPGAGFDDMEFPVLLDQLVAGLGATPVKFPMAARCCGGAQMMTNEEMALRMCKNILLSAQENGADCIVTTCPLCQMNLDTQQGRINGVFQTDFALPVLFFTQLMGMAFGEKDLGLEKLIVRADVLTSKIEKGA